MYFVLLFGLKSYFCSVWAYLCVDYRISGIYLAGCYMLHGAFGLLCLRYINELSRQLQGKHVKTKHFTPRLKLNELVYKV